MLFCPSGRLFGKVESSKNALEVVKERIVRFKFKLGRWVERKMQGRNCSVNGFRVESPADARDNKPPNTTSGC
jgi:hypothetical protein